MRLPPSIIAEIKSRLWAGENQETIAETFKTSQPTVSNIKRGRIGANVPWPTGELGPMPSREGRKSESSGWSAAAIEYSALPELAQLAVLNAVNEAREASGQEPYPEIAPEMILYLQSKDEYDPIEDSFRSSIAQNAENARRSNLYLEWKKLLEQRLQSRRISDLGEEMDKLARHALEEAQGIEALPREDGDITYTKMDLAEFKARAPEHMILKKAEKEGDLILLEALLIIANYWRVNSDNWKEPSFFRQVYQLKRIISEREDIRKAILDRGKGQSPEQAGDPGREGA